MFVKAHLGHIASRTAAGLVALASLALLASCGGGTYQIERFVPARLISFGDESSKLTDPQGLKYSINGISASTDLIDCTVNQLWNQILGYSFNLVYQDCNSEAVASPEALDMTTLNATVDDTVNQVSAFGMNSFNGNDLVTIWVGVHDVLNDYAENGGSDQTTLVNDMRTTGQTLAGLVNAITATGAKVILLTIPDMGQSPYAYAEQQRGDFDREALLNSMSNGFNLGLRTTILNDGSKIGLVQVDDIVTNMYNNPNGSGLIDLPGETAGCEPSAPLPNCTDQTLVTDPSKNSNLTSIYLWADATHLAPAAHTQIGNEAVSRAHGNPF